MTLPAADKHDTINARIHAWLLDRLDATMHRLYGRRKQTLFAECCGDVVLEIGAGAGANLRYYPPSTNLIAVEPNPAMHARLRKRAAAAGVDVEIRGLPGEALDLSEAAVDTVVLTLVLCSVSDPAQVVREIRRVLKPGGKCLFVEHVAAPAGSPMRGVQRLLRRPHRWCFDGCCTDRETAATLVGAGFRDLTWESFSVRSPLPYVAPHIAGIAVK